MKPLRVLVVGAGSMGRAWLAAVAASPAAELVGVADLDLDAAQAAAPGVEVDTDAVALAERTGADALIDVATPAAHHPVTTAALFAGLPVLGEKPAAATLAEALSLAAAAEVTGTLFMVSQSRRWNPHVFSLRAAIAELGPVGTLTTQFFRAPRFGGFRATMAHPLLVDMAIHAFDTARFLLDAEPVTAYCETSNPPWSWSDGDASATAVFAMEGGARYAYTGSWCAPGDETSWNGEWRVSAEKGSAAWDGEQAPQAGGVPVEVASGDSGIAAALTAFVDAVRTGERPSGEIHENVMSLAMVEAAVHSAQTGTRVLLDDVLAHAHAAAVRNEQRDDVRAALAAWTSPRAALVVRSGGIG